MKEYRIIYENDENVLLEIFNYLIYYDKNNVYQYEVIKEENEYFTHLKNYDKLSEAIERIAIELKKEGK